MLTVASIMKNEAGRFLPSWLEAVTQFADRIVVADDASTDGTAEMCEAAGCEVVRGCWGMQGNEWQARKALWDAAVPGSEWIVHIDADQIPAGDFRECLGGRPRIGFVVYDLWDEAHYRCDPPWSGHDRWFWHALNVKDFQDHEWTWKQRGWHSGHLPANADDVSTEVLMVPKELGLLHYGFVTPELRKEQWKKYLQLGPHLTADEREHGHSIRDRHITLRALGFRPTWRLRWAST